MIQLMRTGNLRDSTHELKTPSLIIMQSLMREWLGKLASLVNSHEISKLHARLSPIFPKLAPDLGPKTKVF